jgi:HAD superfamily hydrolase (TIGR01509 family)
MIDVVLFDMDGLLVDSEPEWFVIEQQVYARLGAHDEWSEHDARSLVGNALSVSAGIMVQQAGAQVAVSEVVEWFVSGMVRRLREGVPWKPGARELLEALAVQGVPAGLVSSSHRRLLDVVLDWLPAGTFATSVAGDEVGRGKPHPEPYLTAMEHLGARPAHTVVLEDSPTGARAGAAAGCCVVLVPDRATVPERHDWVQVASLRDVTPRWLAALLGGDGG